MVGVVFRFLGFNVSRGLVRVCRVWQVWQLGCRLLLRVCGGLLCGLWWVVVRLLATCGLLTLLLVVGVGYGLVFGCFRVCVYADYRFSGLFGAWGGFWLVGWFWVDFSVLVWLGWLVVWSLRVYCI